jgi:eukaryotic-like serine/threonine-protein kinase
VSSDTVPGRGAFESGGAETVQEGDLLDGKYRVSRVIGRGGMSIVVEASHDVLEQKVAIKLVTDKALRMPDAVERLLLEARAAAKLTSHHAVRVFDVGTLANGTPFLVMERLVGSTLQEALVRAPKPLPILEVVDWILEVCDAVAEAHSHAIIHRDLKPENLFLTDQRDGPPLVKVLDFGIAKALDAERELTLTGRLLGTPHYMAPEQVQSARDVDGRTDVWALGVVLFRLLTRTHAFDGRGSPGMVPLQILEEKAPPIRARRADIPEELAFVIARCLEKDRLKRWPSIAEFATALLPFASPAKASYVERIQRLIRPGQRPPPPLLRPLSVPLQTAGSTRRSDEALRVVHPVEAPSDTIVDPPRSPSNLKEEVMISDRTPDAFAIDAAAVAALRPSRKRAKVPRPRGSAGPRRVLFWIVAFVVGGLVLGVLAASVIAWQRPAWLRPPTSDRP